MGLFRRAPQRPQAPQMQPFRPAYPPPAAAARPAPARTAASRPRWDLGAGNVVWTAVQFMEQPGVTKDRPVLIVGREPGMLVVLMLSTQQKHSAHRDWYPLGPGPWDAQGRPSWVRLHPYYRMREGDVRRPGGRVDLARFDALRGVLAHHYGWSFPNG